MFLRIPLIHWNAADLITDQLEFICRKEPITLEIIRSQRTVIFVSMCNVAARKLWIIVDTPVKIRPCAPTQEYYHLIFACFSRHIGIILIIFAMFLHYFDMDKSAVNIKLSWDKYWLTSTSALKNIAYISFFDVGDFLAVVGLFLFDLIWYFSWKKWISIL